MNGFNDCHCSECDGHIGWFGKAEEQPACPNCGHYDPEAVKDLAEKIDKIRQKLLEAGR